MRRLFLILCLCLQTMLVSAQTWEVGISAGASGYMGDINQADPLKFTDPAFGLLAKRNFDGYWSARLSFIHGAIRGDDAESSNAQQRLRNLNFRSELSELSLQVEFNMFKYLPGVLPGYGTRRLSPFLFTGVSGIAFNPVTTDNAGVERELQPLQTEGVEYKKYALSVPYGAGVKYNLTGNLSLIGQVGYRTAFTDYMDDISGVYPDFGVIEAANPSSRFLSYRTANSFVKPGTQRGDYRKRDTYMFTMVSLTYTFVPIKCPTF